MHTKVGTEHTPAESELLLQVQQLFGRKEELPANNRDLLEGDMTIRLQQSIESL
jgi:hypothetical protein